MLDDSCFCTPRAMEVVMKKAHVAAVIAAAAFAGAFPAWAVGPSKDAPDPTAQRDTNQTYEGSAATPSVSMPNPTTKSRSDKNKSGKHPPTATMDRATPAEKSTEQGGDAGKHPPSRAMERALPDQKSPDTSGSKKADTQG
jgi:hypothetical protein